MRNVDFYGYGSLWLEDSNIQHIYLDDCSKSIAVSFERSVSLINSERNYVYHVLDNQKKIYACYSISPPLFIVALSHEIILLNSLDKQAISFCPDFSKAVVLTSGGLAHILSSNLEIISNFSLVEEGFGSALPMSLGWGKKETQFHGSEGKEAALTKPVLPTNNMLYDDGRFEVAWRDDGLYFAVSWLDASAENRRRIRVYNDSGELFSTTELTNMISPGLCWRPRVQLITAVQRREGRGLDIIFFESNSQRHGDFELLSGEIEKYYQVESIMFNPTGSVLAVLCKGIQDHPWFIRLLTCSNYQWSTKQHLYIQCPQNSDKISSVALTWDLNIHSTDLSTLYCAVSMNKSFATTSNSVGQTLIQCWKMSNTYSTSCLVTNCGVNTSLNSGLVTMINGNTVEMSSFAYCVIPPPMFATKLIFCPSEQHLADIPFVLSVSTPNIWLSHETESLSAIPMIVQTTDNQSSKLLFPNIYFLTVTTGTSLTKALFCNDKVCAEWYNGAQSKAPWPSTVIKINMEELFSEEKHPELKSILDDVRQKNACIFSQLSCFSWLSLCEVLFIAADGLLLGYLQVKSFSTANNSNDNVHGRWLLRTPASAGEFRPLIEKNSNKCARLSNICCTPDRRVCVQLSNGVVNIYPIEDLLSSEGCREIIQSDDLSIDSLRSLGPLNCTIRFPSTCEQLLCIPVFDQQMRHVLSNGFVDSHLSNLILLGFNKSLHRLFAAVLPKIKSTHFQQIDSTVMSISDCCSSVAILPEFLLVTTTRKLLMCASLFFDSSQLNDSNSFLKELLSRLNVPSELESSNRKTPRNWYNDNLHPIESGAVIVTAIPNDTKVILQMSRGNLEEVHPRALVLAHLSKLLNNKQYDQAVTMMRRHRINFNLLYDHDPRLFLSNVKQFLQTVKDPDSITLFISDLVEEDVTQTIYHKFYSKSIEHHESMLTMHLSSTAKLDSVTDTLIEEMEKLNASKLIVPIVTCYAKKVPPNYEAALLRLKKLYDRGEIQTWNTGLRHLQYFATPIELYKVALGTYDLNLAETMAQRTQLDPKEYLFELKELRLLTSDLNKCHCSTFEEAIAYQRYKIDNCLKRYSKAVLHLIASGSQHRDEMLSYVKTHHLYAHVAEVLPKGSEEFKELCLSWAEYLISTQNLISAGQIYMKGGYFGLAAKTFLSATHTQLWCVAATRGREVNDKQADETETSGRFLTDTDRRTQALKLTARLKDLRRHQEAIQVYVDILEDPETAIRTACEDCLWMDAHRLASLYKKNDFLNQILKSYLIEHHSVLKERLQKAIDGFDKLFSRLMILRRTHKEQAETQRFAQMYGDIDNFDDNFTESETNSDVSSLSGDSITSSMSQMSLRTAGSKKSGRSMKARRKQESKKWSSKPGNKYEEVGLLYELTQSVELGQTLANDVTNAVVEFWDFSLYEEGRTLVHLINDLLRRQRQGTPHIWDDWIIGKCTEENEQHFFGRKKYPIHEAFLSFPPKMKKTTVECYLFKN
uniref:Elongator complex protein 1 n=1 Tax=Trichobilharzia regenti TaxID=157069 RepID=A0AA85ILA5_TRIRE|nr:unnamed protein product [Trichobilharzia regenti]